MKNKYTKKTELIKTMDRLANELFGPKVWKKFKEDGCKWKVYRSKDKRSVVMVRKEEADDRLLVLNRNHIKDEDYQQIAYYAIGDQLWNHDTREEVTEQEMIDDVLDFYHNEFTRPK